MQEDLSGNRAEKKRFTRHVPGWLPTLGALAVAASCALYAHERGVTSAASFLGLTFLTGAALAFVTLMLDNWFHRPTHGTSGGLGALYIWGIARILATAVIVMCGLSGAASYVGAYLIVIIVCGILDALFVFTSL